MAVRSGFHCVPVRVQIQCGISVLESVVYADSILPAFRMLRSREKPGSTIGHSKGKSNQETNDKKTPSYLIGRTAA